MQSRENLRISLVQSDLFWEAPAKNRPYLSELMEGITDTDLIILPEMCTTGFSMNPTQYAEEPQTGASLPWLKKIAAQKNCAVIAGVMVKDSGTYWNRLYFVHPEGTVQEYNKRHLFSLAGEEKIYSAGMEKRIVNFRGWRINPQICYDLRFPVWSRNVEYSDLIIYIANWPERRNTAWKTLLQARAIENLCYVAGVNRVGNDGNEVYHSGDSAVYSVLGEKISTLPPHKRQCETVTLSKTDLQKARKKFSFLEDRDRFTLEV